MVLNKINVSKFIGTIVFPSSWDSTVISSILIFLFEELEHVSERNLDICRVHVENSVLSLRPSEFIGKSKVSLQRTFAK